METIGTRIKNLRISKGLTLEYVSKSIGKSKGNISSYENNKYEPSAQTIISLATLFNVSTDYLLTGKQSINQSITTPNLALDKERITSQLNERDFKLLQDIIELDDISKSTLEEQINFLKKEK